MNALYPPTPAFAKAGAAPGTTAGVEPVLKSPFASMAPSYRPQPSVFHGVQACRLPARKCFCRPCCRLPAPKCFCRPCQGNSPSYRPQPSVFKGVKPAICPPSNAPAGLAKATLAATGPSHLFLTASTPAVCLAFKCFQPFRKPFWGNFPSYRLQPSVFREFKPSVSFPHTLRTLPGAFPKQLSQLQVARRTAEITRACDSLDSPGLSGLARAISFSCMVFQRACHAGCAFPRPSVFHGVQACRHLFLKAFKAAVCPSTNASAGLVPRQLTQLQAPAICFSWRSSLPFARPQMLLQALCQGNSPSYRPQPSVFHGVQACRLPAHKCSRRPRQGNSPSYRPEPSVFKGVQASCLPAHKCFRGLAKATLPATGPSHLFLRAFKPATCPPSNASEALPRQLSQLQAPAICF